MSRLKFKAADGMVPPSAPNYGKKPNPVPEFAEENDALLAEGFPEFLEAFTVNPVIYDLLDTDGGKQMVAPCVVIHATTMNGDKMELVMDPSAANKLLESLGGAISRIRRINRLIEQSSTMVN